MDRLRPAPPRNPTPPARTLRRRPLLRQPPRPRHHRCPPPPHGHGNHHRSRPLRRERQCPLLGSHRPPPQRGPPRRRLPLAARPHDAAPRRHQQPLLLSRIPSPRSRKPPRRGLRHHPRRHHPRRLRPHPRLMGRSSRPTPPARPLQLGPPARIAPLRGRLRRNRQPQHRRIHRVRAIMVSPRIVTPCLHHRHDGPQEQGPHLRYRHSPGPPRHQPLKGPLQPGPPLRKQSARLDRPPPQKGPRHYRPHPRRRPPRHGRPTLAGTLRPPLRHGHQSQIRQLPHHPGTGETVGIHRPQFLQNRPRRPLVPPMPIPHPRIGLHPLPLARRHR